MNVAIFGGSFNPPHVAHVLAAALVLATEPVDRLLVVPAFRHPFAKDLAPFDARVKMCERAMGDLPGVEVSRVEEELGGESRTLRTLEHLREGHPDWRMRLVMGGDLVGESGKWHRFDEIQKIAPPIVLGRVGFEAAPGTSALLPDVSSTDVRKKIADGKWSELARLVPRSVIAFVREQNLYGAS
ncbi:MAG: nicotinate-nicotinamide nucleotide adenylyltransferase [Polyangiaceae bacterium]